MEPRTRSERVRAGYMGVGADVIGRSAPTPYDVVRGRVMSHTDATVKLSVEHIRLFGGMDVKRSNVVRVPPPTHPGVGGVHVCVCVCVRVASRRPRSSVITISQSSATTASAAKYELSFTLPRPPPLGRKCVR